MQPMKKFLHRYTASAPAPAMSWPPEFLCPLSSKPMSDPVVLSSGQSYERNCISAWIQSGQTQCYLTEQPLSTTDHPSTLVANLSLRSAIQRFCQSSGLASPSPPSIDEARFIVAHLLPPTAQAIQPRICHSAADFGSGAAPPFPLPVSPLPVPIEPVPESGDFELVPPPSPFVQRLRSSRVDEQAAAVLELRQLTKSDRDQRSSIATNSGLLSALLALTSSADSRIQSDSIATIMNLSLEKENKVLLVRSGALQLLLGAIQTGSQEARGHAVAGIFSLSVEEENRIVMGVVGTVPPLLRLIRSAGDGDRVAAEDAAMALYYLSLDRGNKGKMIHDGAIPILVRRAMESLESGDCWNVCRARCFMILCNLAVTEEGRRALLVSNAVGAATVEIERATGAGPTEEHALALMLVIIGKGNGRFMAAGVSPEVVRAVTKLAQHGKGRTKEKANALLKVVKEAQALQIDGDGGELSALPPMPNFAGGHCLTGSRSTGF